MKDAIHNPKDETADAGPVIGYRSAGSSQRSNYEMGPTEQKIQIVVAVAFLIALGLLALFIIALFNNPIKC